MNKKRLILVFVFTTLFFCNGCIEKDTRPTQISPDKIVRALINKIGHNCFNCVKEINDAAGITQLVQSFDTYEETKDNQLVQNKMQYNIAFKLKDDSEISYHLWLGKPDEKSVFQEVSGKRTSEYYILNEDSTNTITRITNTP